MNKKDVNEAYDKLLESTVIKDDQLTDETVEDLSQALTNVRSDVNKMIMDLPSNQGVDTNENAGYKIEEVEADVHIDPETGRTMLVDEEQSTTCKFSDETLDDIIGLSEEELKDVRINRDETTRILKDEYGLENISEIDLGIIIRLAERYKNKEKFSYFASLPSSIKDVIMGAIGSIGVADKTILNMLAKQLFESIIQFSYLENTYTDLQTSIDQSFKEFENEMKDTVKEYDKQQKYGLEVRLKEQADKIEAEDPEKAALLRRISNNYTQAYTYEEMFDAYMKSPGKFKTKKIELEKFNSRICEDFNHKYENSKFVITDIKLTIPVLKRYVDPEYTEDDIKRFIAVFVKYTRNMHPEKIDEHVFMYYFIKNILSLDYLDVNDPEVKEFRNKLIIAINAFIGVFAIRESDSTTEKDNTGGDTDA